MFGKKRRFVDDAQSPGRKLRSNLVDLYAEGRVGANRLTSLLNDAGQAGVAGCKVRRLWGKKNVRAQRVQSTLTKSSGWPGFVELDVPFLEKDGTVQPEKTAFLWPHLVLRSLLEALWLGPLMVQPHLNAPGVVALPYCEVEKRF